MLGNRSKTLLIKQQDGSVLVKQSKPLSKAGVKVVWRTKDNRPIDLTDTKGKNFIDALNPLDKDMFVWELTDGSGVKLSEPIPKAFKDKNRSWVKGVYVTEELGEGVKIIGKPGEVAKVEYSKLLPNGEEFLIEESHPDKIPTFKHAGDSAMNVMQMSTDTANAALDEANAKIESLSKQIADQSAKHDTAMQTIIQHLSNMQGSKVEPAPVVDTNPIAQ